MKYCIDKIYNSAIPLIVISIDFTKAYDSVKREKLIKVLKDYKVNANLIDIISNLYNNDQTIMNKNQQTEIEINVTCGIKQGCTASTTLFKLITYEIIKNLENSCIEGFKDNNFRIKSLFYADDVLLLTHTVVEAEKAIDKLIEVGGECGLTINMIKSKILIFNMKEKPISIRGIKVVREIKYLGVKINDTSNCFKNQKLEAIAKADRMANLTYPVIAQSCHKLLIRKNYWKSVILPSVLYGCSVIEFTKTEIEKLQIIENKVYRHILGAPSY